MASVDVVVLGLLALPQHQVQPVKNDLLESCHRPVVGGLVDLEELVAEDW
ncbi:hypothetical protein [Actinomadura rubrisoli]|nr:hypothetical protein [Actinomadura rubrisoli]